MAETRTQHLLIIQDDEDCVVYAPASLETDTPIEALGIDPEEQRSAAVISAFIETRGELFLVLLDSENPPQQIEIWKNAIEAANLAAHANTEQEAPMLVGHIFSKESRRTIRELMTEHGLIPVADGGNEHIREIWELIDRIDASKENTYADMQYRLAGHQALCAGEAAEA